MATDEVTLTDAGARRQQAIAELNAEDGPDWQKEFAPGTFGCHELLDRVGLIAGLVDEQILEHPACLQSEEWFQLAESAVAALNELSQQIGAAHLDQH